VTVAAATAALVVGSLTGAPQATAAPAPTDLGATPLLPDLRARPATGIRVVVSGGQRRLRFASALANIGAGPLEVVRRPGNPCPAGQLGMDQAVYQDSDGNGLFTRGSDVAKSFVRSGCMHTTPGEDQWHVDASARYWLTAAGRFTPIVRHPKVSFCIRDSSRVRPTGPAAFYGHCSRTGRKGISVGWSDLYQSFLPGQSLRLPRRVAGGLYCLWQQADPVGLFAESNEDNNVSVRAIRITRRNTVRPLATNARCLTAV
jgi:hypothetical protein